LWSKLLLVFAGVAVHNIVVLAMSRGDAVLLLLATRALTGAIYTSIIAWIFFLFSEGKITFQKFKAIF
jgi:hypothetical protein